MPDLPVMLHLRGRRCVIIGGGSVALRRAGALLDADADVTVIAPILTPALRDLPVRLVERDYQAGDLHDAHLVVVATDDAAVNQAACDDARAAGAWVNRADDPSAGDLSIPAHAHHGPVTLAVHTSGISAAAAATLRKQLSDAMDPDWPRLLTLAAPFRKTLQEQIHDPAHRRRLLRRLTDPQSLTILKTQGEAALRRHLTALTTHP